MGGLLSLISSSQIATGCSNHSQFNRESSMLQRSSTHITISIAVTILLLGVSAVAQQNVNEMYQRALMLDESNQNLAEAIRLYNLVISQAKDHRSLAARAQYQMGKLYKRLGRKAEAQRAFKTVVSQYQD